MISTTEAAEILGVHAVTLVDWRKRNYGPQPITRFGRSFVYDREQVEEWARKRAEVLPGRKPTGGA